MGFLEGLGDVVKKLGMSALAAPGVIYDSAALALPGDQWGDADDDGWGWGNLFDAAAGRGGDLVRPLTDISLTHTGYSVGDLGSDALHGANWLLSEADQGVSSAFVMARHTGLAPGAGKGPDFGELFNGDAWAKSYEIADHQSTGKSIVNIVTGDAVDPFTQFSKEKVQVYGDDGQVKTVTDVTTPFEASNPNALESAWAFGINTALVFKGDPTSVALQGVGKVRAAHTLAKIPVAERGSLFGRLDGSVGAVEGGPLARLLRPNYERRLDGFVAFIAGENKLGRPLLAAEIRAASPELTLSSGGQAISAALADAAKIEDVTDRANAIRRIVAVGAGDVTQIERLATEVESGRALADRLRNITRGSTVDLKAQALRAEVAADPAFRVQVQQQIDNLDADGDLGKMFDDWHKNVTAELKLNQGLARSEGQLDFVPGLHKGPFGSQAKVDKLHGKSKLDRVEQAHDKMVSHITERMTRFPGHETRTTVFQQGLHSVPIIAAYPIKWTLNTLPTKYLPAVVRNLSRTHFVGVANVHDWDGSVDQLNSMMHLGGVDEATRVRLLSDATKASQESDRIRLIHTVEAEVERAAVKRAGDKYGVKVDDDFITAVRDYAQNRRGQAIGSMNGGRQYSASQMSDDMAFRARGMMEARQAAALDNKLANETRSRYATEEAEDAAASIELRMDHYIDESGVPVSLPLVTSQLTNRVPLMDVNLLNESLTDVAKVKRMETLGDTYRHIALDSKGLEEKLLRAKGDAADRLRKRIMNNRKMQDHLLSAASFTNRWWKMSVLYRLGYPMRVLADDHMRIASQIGYSSFIAANAPEALSNTFYNHMPGVMAKALGSTTRKTQAKMRMAHDKAERQMIRDATGWQKPLSKDEWKSFEGDVRAMLGRKTPAQERAAARARVQAMDPDGKAVEFYELTHEARRIEASIRAHKRHLAKMRERGDDATAIAQREATIRDLEGGRAHTLEQLTGRPNPADLRDKMEALEQRLMDGWKAYRDPKRQLGEGEVTLPNGQKVHGAFDPMFGAYREASSSSHAFNYQITDGEEMGYALNSAGHWRTVAPSEPGYYQLWANILNHQFQHSPEFMSIVKGEVTTPAEFVKWLNTPERKQIAERMAHYAHNADDWGGRLITMTADYVPSRELARVMSEEGRVSARQLQRLFPQGDARLPNIHGSLADVQSGRAGAARALSAGIQNTFRYLSEVPTDKLSRHPFFNAVYQREVRIAADVKLAAKGENARFNSDELTEIERIARQKALKELKRTLWDVSAHSHAAHTMRFLSPFFAAHQEALMRWWNIAKDKPQVVRRFQLAFDAPRHAGLTVDQEGNPVEPGEGIGPGHSIVMKLPFADSDNAVNDWLLKMGGGKYWEVGENGFNLILQNGIANPGAGPMVTAPLETIVQRYADEKELEKAARLLNGFPPAGDNATDITLGAFTPAWTKRVAALMRGEKSAEFSRYYMQNFSDGLVKWNETHQRPPSRAELVELENQAKTETHRDMWLMLGSNLTMFTPAKPNSEYEGVRNGLRRLYQQMRTEGHDMEWLRSTFKNMYGEPYMAFIYSMGTNPGDLDGTKGEVASLKKHSRLLRDINDPTLARMIIGPDVAGMEDELKLYSDAAASWEVGEGFKGSRNPRDVAESLVVAQGWRQFEELTNYLQVQADQMGLSSYEESKELVATKRQGLAVIKQNNPVFRDQYDSWSRESYDRKVDLMRMIASSPRLQRDPFRQDIYWLSQYITVRDQITAELRRRAAEGGNVTIGAESNADLSQTMARAVSYINQQSPYFRQFHYDGIIERDPYLLGEDVSE